MTKLSSLPTIASAALCAAALTLTLAAPAFAAPSIVNGSFEDPQEAPNSLTEITNTGIPGWTGDSIGGATHEYIINGNIEDLNGRDYGTTPFGEQYLGLNAIYRNSFHSIESQSVSGFDVGQSYVLTVYFANLDGASDPDLSVVVSDGTSGAGSILAQQIFVAPVEGPYGQGNIDFIPETLEFTATSDSATFSIGNDSHSGVLGVDNVSLADAVSAAPEPSAWLLLTMGVGLIGATLRSSRRRPGMRTATA